MFCVVPIERQNHGRWGVAQEWVTIRPKPVWQSTTRTIYGFQPHPYLPVVSRVWSVCWSVNIQWQCELRIFRQMFSWNFEEIYIYIWNHFSLFVGDPLINQQKLTNPGLSVAMSWGVLDRNDSLLFSGWAAPGDPWGNGRIFHSEFKRHLQRRIASGKLT